MDNRPLLAKTQNDIREALNPTYDGFGNIILKPSEAPDISTMLNLRDLSDYQNGKYSTTAMTENGFDPYTHLLQQGLNLIGATDKFGNKLKEDGILGPKTQWAIDVGDVGQTIGDLVGFNGKGNLMGLEKNGNQVGSQTLNGEVPIPYYDSIKRLFPDLDIELEDFTRQISLSGTSANNHKVGKRDLRNIDNIRTRQVGVETGNSPTMASDNLITFLKNYESFYDKPYIGLDSQNRTIGYGHVINEKTEGTKYNNGITDAEATELLKDDLNRVVYQYLNPWLNNNSITLNQQQYDALVSFTFNAGPNWITKYDDLRNILKSEDIAYETIHTEFMDWTKVNGEPALGLYRRRMDELDIFFNGGYSRNYPDWP